MSGFPNSPRLIKGGLVLVDPRTSAVRKVISLQYNPDTLTRTLQSQGAGQESGDRTEALRLKGPPVETVRIEVELDATDALEASGQGTIVAEFGIRPQLAAFETILYPSSNDIQANHRRAQAGTLEIVPMESALILFVWGKDRIVPVKLTEFSITEEAFDQALNPIRAKLTLGMRVLTVNDLPFTHKGSSLFLLYQQAKERVAEIGRPGELSTLGIGAIP